jgi:M6 family metalloprotease-like protein
VGDAKSGVDLVRATHIMLGMAKERSKGAHMERCRERLWVLSCAVLLVLGAVGMPCTSQETVLGIHSTTATGEKQVIVIFVDFPGLARQFTMEMISDRILKFVGAYFQAASYDTMWFRGETAGPYVLPHLVEDYRIEMQNLEVDPRRVLALIKDAVEAADADVEFSEDSLVVLALGASHREYGMVGLCGYPGMLGWSTTASLVAPSGERLQNVAIFCENAHLGTYVHDITHMLGGVQDGKRLTPCLYDHDLQAEEQEYGEMSSFIVNMGYWDPMSSHFPYDRTLPPAGLSSWTKMRLGWIEPTKIALVLPGETKTVRLDPLSESTSTTLAIKIPLTEDTYYLLENRQPIDSDANLPAFGVLILYADDTVSECRDGASPVKAIDANPEIPYLMGAAFNLETHRVFLDVANNLAIVLLEKVGQSYDILITTAVVAAGSLP